MHVGFDLLFLIPGETGGRETYARELIPELFAVEPALAATAFVGRDATPELVAELHTAMRVVRLPMSTRRPDQWAIGELARLPVAGRRASIDLLHSLANFAPVSGRFRRVMTLHDLQYRAVPELLTPARRLGTAVLLEAAARRADRIITVSQASGHEITENLGIAPDRIDVIPNGVRLPDAAGHRDTDELRARFTLGDRPVALAVGSDLPHKNLDRLLDAMALVPEARRPVLVLAGPGTDGPRLREKAMAAGVSSDVHLAGFVAAADLDGLYALAELVVLPSLYEGFGLPALEAMARGVPVVCADIPPLREVTGDAALRFAPERTPDMAAAIEMVLTHEGLRTRLASAGRARVAAFTWRRAADQTLASYRRALDVDGSGAA
jgi:glycosyltransferase involved in cell wall biosynthesis